jgi:hypothetical protein
MKRSHKYFRRILAVLAGVALLYAFLLIPEHDASLSSMSNDRVEKQPFAWNQDDYWNSLEAKYRDAQKSGCQGSETVITSQLGKANLLLRQISQEKLLPDSPEFSQLEQKMFEIAPEVAACEKKTMEYVQFITDLRKVVKDQSEHWNMNSDAARMTLYRLLYGGRTAAEEIMMRVPAGSLPGLIRGTDEPSQTPSVEIRGVRIHSGDIIVSRGGAPTSALIARGNDYPGNFSHIALVYVDPKTHEAKIIESHIEIGVVVSTVEQYLKDKKLRVMLMRPRADLPQIIKDPMLPHKAAEFSYKRASEGHIPYDFEMDYKDHSKLFCSEVASEAYEKYGINLWAGISHISSRGLRNWLAAFGVRHFDTQEPSDLEYDPQLIVVAEWRDPETLRKDRMDNAVTEVMLEGAEEGDDLSYKWYLLPVARLVKAYSVILNSFGQAGPIPEGMSATAALRTQDYGEKHKAIEERLSAKARQYKKKHGYEPPYWALVSIARKVKKGG